MGRQDVAEALRRLDDPALCHRVAEGETEDLEDLDLDQDELMLVQGAADDFPEVAGFAFDLLGADLQPDVVEKIPGRLKWNDITLKRGYAAAATYALGDGSV